VEYLDADAGKPNFDRLLIKIAGHFSLILFKQIEFMKKNNYKIYIIKSILLLSILLLMNCNDQYKKIEKIKPDPSDAEEVNLSNFVDTIEYIRLETNPICLIGPRIHRITVKQKYVYVHDIDQHIIFVFDKQGKYIAKLDKQGRGPDEYLALGAFFVDEDEEYIDIIALSPRQHRLLRYSNLSFTIKNIKPIPAITANSVRRINNTFYYGCQRTNNIINDEILNADIFIVENDEIKKTLFENEIPIDNTYFAINPETFTINNENEIFASIRYDNVFYQIINHEAIPIFEIDFGKYNYNNKIKNETGSNQVNYWQENPLVASFPVLNINNSKLLSFSYGFNKTDYHYIFFKDCNKSIHAKSIINDVTGFPERVFLNSGSNGIIHEVWEDNYINDIVLPSRELKSLNDSIYLQGVGTIKITDNPVIVRMKLRNCEIVE
jgi:hypothetical protein